MNESRYVGQELDIFAQAKHWKNYWSSAIRPYITGDVLEVGAGLGANEEFLHSQSVSSWTCLEPDPELAGRIRTNLDARGRTAGYCVTIGTTQTMESQARFQAILYIDVLEHIEHDRQELACASRLLHDGGTIIVLSPAHQWLYTPFDRAIGHFRRYDRASLAACSPADCVMERLVYLDSIGMLASLANRMFLQQSMPTLKQVLFWDRFLVPPSTLLDPVLAYSAGKSILGIWRKTAAAK
jgi:2-polyprenyl-3-methyl-5-hydroxy-6-metoxy-1,4-benzoquinol methylase